MQLRELHLAGWCYSRSTVSSVLLLRELSSFLIYSRETGGENASILRCSAVRSFRVSVQNSSSFNLATYASANVEPDDFLDKLSLLSRSGHLQEALSLFYSAPLHFHSRQSYATLFHACAHLGFLHQGRVLHDFMTARNAGYQKDLYVTNHIINMYAKCRNLRLAHQLFVEMPQRNIVSWTALISGYAQSGRFDECFRLFSCMLVECRPNEFTLASVLSSCGHKHGTQVHTLTWKMGLNAHIFVANALIAMYSRSYHIKEAWTVFEALECWNMVSWNSMIAGFQHAKFGTKATHLFASMHGHGIQFDRATLLSVFPSLSATHGIDAEVGLNYCLQLHCLCTKTAFFSEVEVVTALLKSYADTGGEIADCYKIFSEARHCKDIVFWTTIIVAFVDCDPVEAFFIFCQLLREDIAPDWYTFSAVLKACAGLVTERHASAIHAQVVKAGFEDDTVLANALIHAYARSGSIALSKQVFDEMGFHDLVSWNSMFKAYGLHGDAREALQLFPQMDVKPDAATFVALLSACSHSGMVEEGLKIFDFMTQIHAMIPQLDHYACMVDILGRAGRVTEANELISRMEMEPDSVIWSSLLGACRKHGEAHLAKLAASKLNELEPKSSLGYVQMSNIYCSGGSFSEAGLIRKQMRGSRVRKEPGLSWTEIENRVYEFASGGRRHPQREAIFAKLEELIGRVREIGYVPDTSMALHDVEEEQKEEQLFHHSEKLALAFATMNEGSTRCRGGAIRIMKNIRICVDCHNFMKLASEILEKEIVVRDSNRFHHFKKRTCSCCDYW